MNNKIFARLAVLLLCKSLTLAAGGAHGKNQEPRKKYLQAKTLLEVAATGNLEGLKAMLESGIDVNMPDESGITALMISVDFYRLRSMHLLLAHGACAYTTDDSCRSAITRVLNRCDKGESKSILRSLLKNTRCTHPVQTLNPEKTPEALLALLQAIDTDYARTQATFLAASIEAVEDERCATVAEVFLMSQRIFPLQSEINPTILSYLSSEKENLEERAHTLARLPKQH